MNADSIARRDACAYIGLGSNLSNPVEQVRSGVAAVSALSGCKTVACSGLYASPPMGPQDQPDYVNAVMSIRTSLSPDSLLKQLQAVEASHGRIRQGIRWVARTLDLDILLYGQEIIETPDLIIPHAGIAERAFVLVPLAEIAPQITIPGKGSITDLLKHCRDDRLHRMG